MWPKRPEGMGPTRTRTVDPVTGRKGHGRVGAVLLPALAVAIGITGLAVSGCGSGDGDGRPQLTVLAASSLQTALTEYAETMPGVEVRQSFAGSDQLAAQIRQGARPDVYAAADLALPRRLNREGLVGQPRVFASNRLVVAVPADGEVASLADLAEPGTTVALGEASVPIGIYADRVLDRLPPAEGAGIRANIASREPEASSITAKLVQGAVDAGFIYQTDFLAASSGLRAIPVPASLQPDIGYGAAVVLGTGEPDLARKYIQGLVGGEGAASLRRAGFQPLAR